MKALPIEGVVLRSGARFSCSLRQVRSPLGYIRRLRREFEDRLNRGSISYRPKILNTDEDAFQYVRRDVRAFTVVDAELVKGRQIDGIRVLTIDRKKPGEDGYPLTWRLTRDDSGESDDGDDESVPGGLPDA